MIGRPESTEFAEYYLNYINAVKGEDPVTGLEEQCKETQEIFSEISDERSLHRYAPGKWSIRQLVNHISDTERMFVFRAMWFARGFDTPLPSFDQEIAARGAEAERLSWASNVQEFQNVRLATISFFRNLPEAAWLRSGIASEKRFTVRALAFITAGHAAYHLERLRKDYL
jgi:DinB superfamily